MGEVGREDDRQGFINTLFSLPHIMMDMHCSSLYLRYTTAKILG